MPAKSRFTRLDAFTKTVEDARIRTTSGGVVTIASLLVVLYLIWGEWSDYRRILVQPELIVDKGRGMSTAVRSKQEYTDSKHRREDGDTPQHHLPANTL
jgi:Endoplasmic Reticulum-Golgi Intermediate Compartment (ERGIC)